MISVAKVETPGPYDQRKTIPNLHAQVNSAEIIPPTEPRQLTCYGGLENEGWEEKGRYRWCNVHAERGVRL